MMVGLVLVVDVWLVCERTSVTIRPLRRERCSLLFLSIVYF